MTTRGVCYSKTAFEVAQLPRLAVFDVRHCVVWRGPTQCGEALLVLPLLPPWPPRPLLLLPRCCWWWWRQCRHCLLVLMRLMFIVLALPQPFTSSVVLIGCSRCVWCFLPCIWLLVAAASVAAGIATNVVVMVAPYRQRCWFLRLSVGWLLAVAFFARLRLMPLLLCRC